MDIIKAKELVSKLAEGIDPFSGEILPEDHICNNAEMVRAFYELLNAVEFVRNRPENAGKPWTDESDEELKRMFKDGANVLELKKHFKRSQRSIEARLSKLGLGGKEWN